MASFDEVATHTAKANLQASRVLLDLLHGWTRPVRLERFRASIDLVQHDRVGFLLGRENFE
jgi:hypothetical protein